MKHPFQQFELKPFLLEALMEQNIEKPMEIQERLIPAIRNGKDVIGQSKTGSGKTLAFLLPIVDQVDIDEENVQAVITAPTRELASQLYDELTKLTKFAPDSEKPRTKLLVGGTDRLKSIEGLKQRPHIVVGTPGRIEDFVREGHLPVQTSRFLVVDETDQMLDMGFIEDVDKIASKMGDSLQMLVFSATIPEKLEPFLRKYMNQPRHVEVKSHRQEGKIEHILVPDRHRDRFELVKDVAVSLNPYLAMIFANTKETAEEIFNKMNEHGLNVDRLHGDITPRERKRVMKRLQKAEVQYLVATDLVARGIDVEGISHIINFEWPKDLDFYIHRVGRTGRAGWDGLAVSIISDRDGEAVGKLEKRGITFTYKDLRHGEWVDVKQKNRHMKSQKSKPGEEQQPQKPLPKAKKVKPGYKKKFQQEQRKQVKREQRLNNRKNKGRG
ncbi:DEAD/DEAH box helicase [Texcoconibacillus texcoconensis]|uniref:ATP-dependent RNA helicase CshB n=1 Tax=Texcoconibacillus texcoconensis TaxID=1095777 RepID=A0A840QRC7_9BACI|nr:DEAD/DEAH box helicase [Texcoconibacillus texcoconensis]MBB5173915.1 ATP-dependent RNA helicase CshB [Texcoconibacillus texcoconensis]